MCIVGTGAGRGANSVFAMAETSADGAAEREVQTREGAAAILRQILSGAWSPEQIRRFLLDHNAVPATPDELAGFLDAVRDAATPVVLPADVAARAIDIVGTGGDKSGSVNVSTMTALVVAGAGVPVCKHGNRSASSACGTADVLEALGARIEQSPAQVAHNVATTGFGFVFAPAFHPAFRHVGPVRRELGVPTVFNLLGPMANPAHVAYMMVGVANDTHLATMASVLAKRTVGSLVVHGHGGLDELSLAGPNRAIATGVVAPVAAASPADFTIDAVELGLGHAHNDALRGGDATHNAQVVTDVLINRLRGPVRDVVVLNAGVALFVARSATSPRAGIELAEASIESGRAKAVLDEFVAASNLSA